MTKKKSTVFYDSFIGEYVIVFLRDNKNMEALTGYLLDMDDSYYLLGQTPDQISQAIKIEDVKYVTVTDPSEVIFEYAPENDRFY